MSGLENFENNETWRNRMRKHLCMERPISTQTFQKVVNTQMDTGDLQTFLENLKQNPKIPKKVDVRIQQKVEEKNGKHGHEKHAQVDSKESWNLNTFSTSEESFMAMERMCNDSTLFRLNSEKTKPIVNVQSQRDFDVDSDVETKALLKLLDEFDVNETEQREIIDLTQLEDIEAPSALWEKSTVNDTVLQTSPVKMVGLLRPSTIIEEGFDESSTASNMSFGMNTTAKCESDDESSCYETAHDTHNGEFKYQQTEQIVGHNETSSDVLDTILDGNESLIITCSDFVNCLEENHLKLSEENECFENEEQQEEKNANDSPNFNDTIEEVEYMLKKGFEYMKSKNTANIELNTENQLSENKTETNHSCLKDNSEIATNATTENNTESGQTNVKEYSTKIAETSTEIKCDTLRKATKSTALSKENACPTSNNCNRFELNIKPMPKLNVFQKPSGIPTTSNMRRKAVFNDKPFDNIVSPIGVYMKKTGITPFLVSTQNKNNVDMHNSSAIRRLDNESERAFQQKYKGLNAAVTSGNAKTYSPRSLPKKAYISSELKKATDERTPVKVPGGSSIQKYIGRAMVPTVVRHDGKLKLNGCDGIRMKPPTTQTSQIDSKISGRKTDIKDFSIMSGDVSVYTIKPARKF